MVKQFALSLNRNNLIYLHCLYMKPVRNWFVQADFHTGSSDLLECFRLELDLPLIDKHCPWWDDKKVDSNMLQMKLLSALIIQICAKLLIYNASLFRVVNLHSTLKTNISFNLVQACSKLLFFTVIYELMALSEFVWH